MTSPDAVLDMKLDELTPSHRSAWHRLRGSRHEFSLPFFAPEFADAVHAVRGDVRVAIVQSGDAVVGVLPHHRIGRVAYPVGRFFNDAHGLITPEASAVDWHRLLKRLSLRSFDAHALVGFDDRLVTACAMKKVHAFAANLGDDSAAYLRRLGNEHVTIKRQSQKTRKMAREVGPVRVEIDCQCPDVLAKVIQWKRDQYARTHILDLFSPAWTRHLVQRLHANPRDPKCFREATLSGLCSVLWAGETPVAAHFGMIENGRLHYWFPAYDPAFGTYSPGTALFRHLVDVASDHGIHTIDMGYGEQPYKQRQTDVVTQVATGCISRCKVHRTVRWVQQAASSIASQVPMKETAKRIVRSVKPDAGIGKLG